MGRRHSGALPAMRLHKQSGQARIRLNGTEYRLGQHGSPTAQMRYDELIAAWIASGRTSVEAVSGPPRPAPASRSGKPATPAPSPRAAPAAAPAADLTVGELSLLFMEFVQASRPNDWKESSAYSGALAASRALRPVAAMPAREFGPRQFLEIREALARTPIVRTRKDGTQSAPKPRSRRYTNDTMGRVVNLFSWAVPRELVPPDRVHGLREVPPLRAGELQAVSETAPREAVDDALVDAILKHLTHPARCLVRFLRSTGCRPTEGATLRMADVTERPDGVWEYRPRSHKNKWRGHARVIFVGPRGQEAIRDAIGQKGAEEYVFDPREARPRKHHRPDTIPIERPRSSSRVKDHYDRNAIRHAIQRACEAAKCQKWFPYLLRYARSSEVRRDHGDNAAQGTLGDRSRAMLDRYAPVAGDAAAAAARATG